MTAAAQQPTNETFVRLARESELPVVLDSWVRSYQGILPWPRWVWTERVAKWAIAGTPVLVVALQAVPDTLLGWCCGKPGLLHYVYVLHDARRQGLATELLTAALGKHPSSPETRGTRITHRPARQYRPICNAVGWQWQAVTKEEIER